MKKLTLSFALATVLFMGFSSCSDDDNENQGENPIHKVEATTEIDLSKYTNLSCNVNGVDYDFVVEGQKVIATPKDGGKIAYTWPDNPEMIGGASGISMSLSRKDATWSSEVVDQGSYEKMMQYDAFSASLGGNLPSVITDLKLVHAFSMLHFTTKNLPENTIVTVVDRVGHSIIPNRTQTSEYQCISPIALNAQVSVSVDGKEYVSSIIYNSIEQKNRAILSDSNNFYTFELEFHPKTEKEEANLTINNGKVVRWINQHFE